MLNRPPSFVNLNSCVSVLSLGHHNANTSPNQTAWRSGGVSLGSTEPLQPLRCQRDHGSSEEEKERVSQLLAGKVRKLRLKHWREQRVSVIPQQEQCVPMVCTSNTAPTLPLSALYVLYLVQLWWKFRGAVRRLPLPLDTRCSGHVIWAAPPHLRPRSLPLPKMWGVWPKSA